MTKDGGFDFVEDQGFKHKENDLIGIVFELWWTASLFVISSRVCLQKWHD